MMHEKKAEERFFVERFLAGAKLEFKFEPGEAPDFKLRCGAECIGLEVTRLFHPAPAGAMPRKAVESVRERVIREAIVNDHEVFARHIVLIRPNTLPKTTSGKTQRNLTRKLWLERKLNYLTAEAV